jgi:ketosteroid isomerase-like protein
MNTINLFLLLSLTISIHSTAPTTKSLGSRSDEDQIVKVQDWLIDAYLHHDYSVLERVLADDYTYIDDDGFVLNKRQILDEFNSGDDQITSYKRQDEKVRVFGETAVMTYRYQAEETYKGHEVGGDMRITRIFAKRKGRWMMVGAQDTRVNPRPEFAAFSSNDEVALKQLEQDWLDAYRDGDADKMSKILADDFVGRWADGNTQTKQEQLTAIRTGEEKHSRNHLDECNVRIYGDTAVVTGTQTEQSVLEGRNGSGTYSYTDVFVRRDGRWQIVATETKRLSLQAATSNPNARDRLMGTWRLVSAGTLRSDGSFEPYPEYGPHPIGYLIYDPTGHMCVSLSNPDHPHWANPEKPTDAEKLRSYDTFFAYCGTYEIREKEGRVIHRPQMGSWPHYIGTDQNRDFRFEGNRLILSGEETPPGGERRRYRITWERVNQ